MPLFLVERNFAEELELGADDVLGITAVNDDVGVRWVYSFLSADKRKTYCLYEAPCKHDVVERAWSVVDNALDVSGGAGIFKRTRLEQLFRDGRLGRIHPANPMLTHELVGKLSLGIDPDSQPRWG